MSRHCSRPGHELGPTYDDALVSSFADRIEKVVERRVSGRTDGLDRADRLVAEAGKRQLVLGVVSLGVGPHLVRGFVFGCSG